MATNNSDRRSPGFWINLFNSFRIAWRLLWDNRGPLGAKIVPILTVLYILSPIDLVPDFIPLWGQLDDLAILMLGVRFFIAVSPKAIVESIRAEFEGRPPSDGWTVTGNQPHDSDKTRSSASDDIIDG